MKKSELFSITERGIIVSGPENRLRDSGRTLVLEPVRYKELKALISQGRNNKNNELSNFIQPGYRKGQGEGLVIGHYVGLVQLKSGLTIEILPKICQDINIGKDTKERAKNVLMKMLEALKDAPYKKHGYADLQTKDMRLYEIFIRMFVDELLFLIKRGLMSDYLSTEENAKFMKGKYLVPENIRYNLIRKDLFYVKYDEFSNSRPENKLIKSTLLFLMGKTQSDRNQKNIKVCLEFLSEIPQSTNYDHDFSLCKINRLNAKYENVIKWCKIFLNNQSFTNNYGEATAIALLYSMQKLFENYLAVELKKSGIFDEITAQEHIYDLATSDNGDLFKLKPDIVARNRNQIHILDAKWKLLNNDKLSASIKQSDMYQMMSYASVYEKHNPDKKIILYLLYPRTEKFREEAQFTLNNQSETKIRIIPCDIEDIQSTFRNL
ncbi:MAG: McrC family protein [Chlorobi bacterium]|nr:McrC family protein [Chlorobiota bacterium]